MKLPSSWSPARVEGGSDLQLLTPLPVDQLDPVDPVQNHGRCDFEQPSYIFGDSCRIMKAHNSSSELKSYILIFLNSFSNTSMMFYTSLHMFCTSIEHVYFLWSMYILCGECTLSMEDIHSRRYILYDNVLFYNIKNIQFL